LTTLPFRTPDGARDPDPGGPPGALAPSSTTAILALAAVGARPARLSHLIDTIASQSARVFRGSALVALGSDDALRVRRGEGVLADCEGEMLSMTGSLAGAAAAGMRPRMVSSLEDDPTPFAELEWANGPALAFPLTAESHAAGAVVVVRAAGEAPFTTAEADAAAVVGAVAGAFLASAGRFAEERERPRSTPGAAAEAGAPGAVQGAADDVLPMASLARALRHEINNSVGVVDAALQLLAREAAPLERGTHYELIDTGLDRLRGLVARLTRLEGDEQAKAYVRDDGALGIR
jgi:hypothetical protein